VRSWLADGIAKEEADEAKYTIAAEHVKLDAMISGLLGDASALVPSEPSSLVPQQPFSSLVPLAAEGGAVPIPPTPGSFAVILEQDHASDRASIEPTGAHTHYHRAYPAAIVVSASEPSLRLRAPASRPPAGLPPADAPGGRPRKLRVPPRSPSCSTLFPGSGRANVGPATEWHPQTTLVFETVSHETAESAGHDTDYNEKLKRLQVRSFKRLGLDRSASSEELKAALKAKSDAVQQSKKLNHAEKVTEMRRLKEAASIARPGTGPTFTLPRDHGLSAPGEASPP